MVFIRPTGSASTVFDKFQEYVSKSPRGAVDAFLKRINQLSKKVESISSTTRDTTIEKYLIMAADLFKQVGLTDYASYATSVVQEELSKVPQLSSSSAKKKEEARKIVDAAYTLISSTIALHKKISNYAGPQPSNLTTKQSSDIDQLKKSIGKLLESYSQVMNASTSSDIDKTKYVNQFSPFFKKLASYDKVWSLQVPKGQDVSTLETQLKTIADALEYDIVQKPTNPVSKTKYTFKLVDRLKKSVNTVVNNQQTQTNQVKTQVKDAINIIESATKKVELATGISVRDVSNALLGNSTVRALFEAKNRPAGAPPSLRSEIAQQLQSGQKVPIDLLIKDIEHQATEIISGEDTEALINRSRVFLKELGLFAKDPLKPTFSGGVGYDYITWNALSQVFPDEQLKIIRDALYKIKSNAQVWKSAKAQNAFIAEIKAKEGKLHTFMEAVPDNVRDFLVKLGAELKGSTQPQNVQPTPSRYTSNVFASQQAEDLVKLLNITDTSQITPTGKSGKITVADIRKYTKEQLKVPTQPQNVQPTPSRYTSDVFASQQAEDLVKLLNITDTSQITPTGKSGKITVADIRKYAKSQLNLNQPTNNQPINNQPTNNQPTNNQPVTPPAPPTPSSWISRIRGTLGRMLTNLGDIVASAGGGGGIFWNLGGQLGGGGQGGNTGGTGGGQGGNTGGTGANGPLLWPANWRERILSQKIIEFRNRIIAEEAQLSRRVSSGTLPPDSPLRRKELIYQKLAAQVRKIPETSQAIRGIVSQALAETHGDISTAFNYILGDYYQATLGQMTKELIEEAVRKESEDPDILALKDPNNPTQMLRTSRNEQAYRRLYERFGKVAKLHLSSELSTKDLLTLGRVAKGSEIAASIGAPVASALVGGTIRTLTAFPDAAIQEAGLSLSRMIGSGMAINRDLLWPLEFAMAGRSGWGFNFQSQFKQGVATAWKNAVPTATLSNLLTSYTGLLHVGNQEQMMQNILSTVTLSRFGGLPAEAMIPSMTMLARLFPKDQQSDWRQFAGVIAGVFENKNLSKAMGTDEIVSMLDTLGSYFVGRAAEINPETLARILGVVGQLNLSDQVPSGLKGALGLNTLLQLTQAVGPKQGEIISPLLAFLTGAGGSMENIMETAARYAQEGIFMTIPGTNRTLIEKILTDLPTMFGGEANAAAYLTRLGISPDISMSLMKLSDAVKSGEIKVTDEDTRKIIEEWLKRGAKGDITTLLKGTQYERYNYMKLLESTTAYEEAIANIGTIPLQMATDFRKQMSPVFGSLYASLGEISMGLTDFLNPIGMFVNLFRGFKNLKNFYSEMPGVGSRGASLMSYQLLGEMGINPQLIATLLIPVLTPIMGNVVEGLGTFFTGKLALSGKLSGLTPILSVLGPATLAAGVAGVGIYSTWKYITEEIKATTNETENLIKMLDQLPEDLPIKEFVEAMTAVRNQIEKVNISIQKRGWLANILPGAEYLFGGTETREGYLSVLTLQAKEIQAVEKRRQAAGYIPGTPEYNYIVGRDIIGVNLEGAQQELENLNTTLEQVAPTEEELANLPPGERKIKEEAILSAKVQQVLIQSRVDKLTSMLRDIEGRKTTEHIAGATKPVEVYEPGPLPHMPFVDTSLQHAFDIVNNITTMAQQGWLSEEGLKKFRADPLSSLIEMYNSKLLNKELLEKWGVWSLVEESVGPVEIANGEQPRSFFDWLKRMIEEMYKQFTERNVAHAMEMPGLSMEGIGYFEAGLRDLTLSENLNSKGLSLMYYPPKPGPERPGLGESTGEQILLDTSRDSKALYLDNYTPKIRKNYDYNVVKPAKELAGWGGSAGGGGAFDVPNVIPRITPISELLENQGKALNAPNLEMKNSNNTFNITVNVDNAKSAAEVVEEMARVLREQQYLPYTIQVGR